MTCAARPELSLVRAVFRLQKAVAAFLGNLPVTLVPTQHANKRRRAQRRHAAFPSGPTHVQSVSSDTRPPQTASFRTPAACQRPSAMSSFARIIFMRTRNRGVKSAACSVLLCAVAAFASPDKSIPISSGWLLQDAAKVPQSGEVISSASFQPAGWHRATVPGTVLTSLVNDGTYPEPLYGENNRPDRIPDTLCRTTWWYRTVFAPPAAGAGSRIWLNFDGINYLAEVWLNGHEVGTIKGAFIRGIFDVTLESGRRGLECPGRPHLPAAASGRHARENHRQRHGAQWRRHRPGRAHFPVHHRLGLDSHHPRPR